MKNFKALLFIFSVCTGIYCKSQTIIDYQTWTGSSGCNIFSATPNVPATLNGSVTSISHQTTIGQPTYEAGSTDAVALTCKVDAGFFKGTEYRISYTFKQGNSYQIKINAACINSGGGTNLNLRVLPTNSNNVTNTTCNGFSIIDQNTSGGEYSNNTINGGGTWTDYFYNYSPFSSQRQYLNISAIPPINSGLQTLYIRKITIIETPGAPIFTLTPASLSVPCGSATTQVFTVNNVNNSPGTITYNWNLGSANNGWIYLGSPAPQTFSSSTNSISLTSSTSVTTLSNVSANVSVNAGTPTSLTSNISVVAPTYSFSINGSSIICNTSDYDIPNLPQGATVSWSIPSNAGPVLQLSQNTPSANSLRITNQKWYQIATTLTATITGLGCGITQSVTKEIYNDNDRSGSQPFSYSQEACYAGNVYHPAESGMIYSNSSPVFVHQGCMVYVTLGNLNGLSVSLTGSAQPDVWGVSTTTNHPYNTLYFTLPLGSGGIPFTFRISGNGACYDKTLLFFTYSNNGRYSFSASPNPAKNTLTVTAFENKRISVTDDKSSTKLDTEFHMNIYDINSNRLLLSKRCNKGSLQNQLNTSSLRKGYYLLQIIEGKQIQTIKFYKE